MSTPKGRARLEAYEERVDKALKGQRYADLQATRPDATAADDGLQPRPDGPDDTRTPSGIPGGADGG